jgi:hypothetical protein
MTPHEQAAIQAKNAARAAVLAKFPDGSAEITDDDCQFLTGDELTGLINAGRFPGIGADKRLSRR